jgi:hypothetical protein
MSWIRLVFKVLYRGWLHMFISLSIQLLFYVPFLYIDLSILQPKVIFRLQNIMLMPVFMFALVLYTGFKSSIDSNRKALESDLSQVSSWMITLIQMGFVVLTSIVVCFILNAIFGKISLFGLLVSLLIVLLLDLIYEKWIKKDIENLEKAKNANREAEHYLREEREKNK